MWHFIVPVAASIPCYAVWTYAGSHPHDTSISYISMYGMAFLGQLLLVAQPVLLSYRSSTLYGAAEQAVGTSTAVASLSIASIIAPQVRYDFTSSAILSTLPTNNSVDVS